jgi:hypothetical protein
MSKKLEKKANKLARKAEDRATAIRRVVRECDCATQISAVNDSAKQREIERAVVKYNEVHKAIKRLRRKMALKGKHLHSLTARRAKYSGVK